MSLNLAFFAFILPCIIYAELCDPVLQANKVHDALNELSSQYIITEGTFYFLQNSTAFFANPSSIYGVWTFPDATRHDSTIYYGRASNAYIFPGCTPPKSIYYSIASYIFTRDNDANNGNEILFADLGASTNHLVFNTSITSESPFNSPTIFVQTADQSTYNDIYNTLNRNNMEQQINLNSIPSEYVNFLPYQYNSDNIHQYNGTYDTLGILMRIAIPENQTEYKEYIAQNQTVYMLEPINVSPNDNTPKIPYTPDTRNPYNSNNINESIVYSPVITQYINDLISYLESTYNLKYIRQDGFVLEPFCLNGYGFYCIDNNKDCAGDNRDTLYWNNPDTPLYQIKNNSYYIIVGINHEYLSQTLYDNIVLYIGNSLASAKPGPSMTNFDYQNSGYIIPVNTSVSNEYLKNIFVIETALHDNCLFPNDLPGFCLTYNEYNDTDTVVFTSRNYLNPITYTRPDYQQIIPNILIEFRFND